MKNIFYYQTPIGKIGIAEENSQITNLYFESDKISSDEYIVKETEILKEAKDQLQEYLNGSRKVFSLPLNPFGTKFAKKVWNCLCDIPYGTTQSYKEIAEKIEHSKAYRAVGLANNRNPIPIFIPCHRVIGTNGNLTGYRGGLEAKAYLLQLETYCIT
ncbi:MAG: methylated-DNA--[protein]-cysteine S-methyltransferase [Candidatus Gastranaerophilaceae bacterium]|jgi:methylated-DNA-[protein]-cysteine S-methyltransferase